MIAEAALYPPEQTPKFILTQEEIANKQNLLKANERMKYFADKKRVERVLSVRDMVYIKLQPYRHTSPSIHKHLKLHSQVLWAI